MFFFHDIMLILYLDNNIPKCLLIENRSLDCIILIIALLVIVKRIN